MAGYFLFLNDYVRENSPEFLEHMEEETDSVEFIEAHGWSPNEDSLWEEDGGREGVYKENYYMREHLQLPNVAKVLATQRGRDAIVEFTGIFIDDHSKQLSTSGPVYMFTFGEKETSFFYNLFDCSPEMLLQVYDGLIQETYYGKISAFFTGWVKNAPHKLLITSILIDAIQNGYDNVVECCEYLWAFCEYPILYRKFWPVVGPKEDVMNYTVEHLGEKNKIKKMKNLLELLKYDTTSAVNAAMDGLRKGVDNIYLDLMQSIRNRINSKFRNIADAYMKNSESNASMHNNVSEFDDGTIADQEGHSTNMAQIVEKTIGKFTSGGINAGMVKVAADGSKVDRNNLTGYLSQIFSDKQNRLPKIIEDLIMAYFDKYPTRIELVSGEFVNFGLALYRSIGTSKDENYMEIRDILNQWMFKIIDIRQYYQREATVINYTRAIFNYVIFMIASYN